MQCPRWILELLRRWCIRIVASRPADFSVGPSHDPYMDRWHILKTRFGGVYVHLFHHDDDDRAIHDHPWSSISLLLQGTQREIYAAPGSDPKDALQHSFRTLREGAITVRPASFAHRIELTSFKAMTLFIVGPKTREWGFWCPKGFRHWIEYCKPDAMGEIGRGCE